VEPVILNSYLRDLVLSAVEGGAPDVHCKRIKKLSTFPGLESWARQVLPGGVWFSVGASDRPQYIAGLAPEPKAQQRAFGLGVLKVERRTFVLVQYSPDTRDTAKSVWERAGTGHWLHVDSPYLRMHGATDPESYKRAPFASTSPSPLEQLIEREEREPD
jgi:hypothetical protein